MKKVNSDGYNQIFGVAAQPTGSEIIATFGTGDNLMRESLYVDNSIARRIVDVIGEEAVKSGFQIQGIADDSAFQSEWDALDADSSLVEAMSWDRLRGGAAVVVQLGDNRLMRNPVAEGFKGIEAIHVYEPEQVKVDKLDMNTKSPRYGKPETYAISDGVGIEPVIVHYSRIRLLTGDIVPRSVRKQLNGFGASVLTADLIEAILDYSRCQRLATKLLERKQQGVWKVQGLADLCDSDEGVSAARLRLAQVDDHGGVGRTIGIDANDEEYEVLNSDIAGVTDFLNGKMDRIVSLSGIHEIILKNLNTKGLNQSQNTALESFNKLIARKQKSKLQPLIEFIAGFMVAEDEWSIVFNPLSVPSKKENAEVLKSNVEALTKLKDSGDISQAEVRDTLEAMESGIVFGTPPEEIELPDESEEVEVDEKESDRG